MFNPCWSNTKRFLSILVVFGKYFVFAKIVKILKIVLPYSDDSVAGRTCCMPQSRVPHRDISRLTSDSLVGKCFSREKDLEYFSKFGFSCFSRLRLVTCSRVEGPVARGTQRFSRLSSRLSHEWNFQSRKTLRKFSKVFFLVFWRLVLATCMRLVSVAKIACFGQTWSVF